MKIVLYLMNEKGQKTLQHLCEYFDGDIIRAVIGSRDPNVQDDYYESIRGLCLENNIEFLDRRDDCGEFNNEHRMAIGWRWMIPSAEKLVIFHDSLLPRYRGFAPLVNALINGEPEIGVTAIMAGDKFDRGDIISQKRISISYPITIEEAIKSASSLYQELAVEVVKAIQAESLKGIPQVEEDASYSIWRDEEDYHINWDDDADSIVRFIDAVGYPYDYAFSVVNNQKVFIQKAASVKDVNLVLRHPGKVMFVEDGLPVIIAGKGLVKLEKITDSEGVNLFPLKEYRIRFR